MAQRNTVVADDSSRADGLRREISVGPATHHKSAQCVPASPLVFFMKHSAHRVAHKLPHHQVWILRWKVRDRVGDPWWRWTRGRF